MRQAHGAMMERQRKQIVENGEGAMNLLGARRWRDGDGGKVWGGRRFTQAAIVRSSIGSVRTEVERKLAGTQEAEAHRHMYMCTCTQFN